MVSLVAAIPTLSAPAFCPETDVFSVLKVNWLGSLELLG